MTTEATRVMEEIGLGEHGSNAYRETFRKLSDGVSIRTSPSSLRGWIRVNILSPEGYYLHDALIPIDEAFGEIPFVLDRARHFDRLFRQQRQEEVTATDGE